MKIAMITSETNPISKTGGLADVVYSLSRELNNLSQETIIISPLYKPIKENPLWMDKMQEVAKFDVFMSWRKQYAGIFELVIENTKFYLIDNEYYFKRENLYGYDDDGERFAFFALAAIIALTKINFYPDIIHVHDWQSGMIPCLMKEKYNQVYPEFKNTRFCLTIHNPAFKGMLDKYFLNNFYGLSDELFDNGKVRFDGQVSTLKAAITYADVISTVSPTHRNELLTYELSHGLNYILRLRQDDFFGILNGIDQIEFNPKTDPNIMPHFDIKNVSTAKEKNKIALLKELHLPYNGQAPLFGLVSRLTWQKGIELILKVAPKLIKRGAYLVFLGRGEYELEQGIEQLRATYPDHVAVYIGYNDKLAHQIYASSDFFLMPSLFEPCGIGQMIAMRYGTLPVVRETGGLKDTVEGFKPGVTQDATGFSFVDFNAEGLEYASSLAIDTYYNRPDLMKKMIKTAMQENHSYALTATKYIEIYQRALDK